METVERFGVSMSPRLLETFDALIEKRGYANRSEALRDIVRNYIVESHWQTEDAEVMGAVTIVYDHHTRELSTALNRLQHDHHDEIVCATHVHIDHDNCLEVIVVRGTSRAVQSLADKLISTKGVKHGKLVCSTTGQALK
jgi:CopG family nickel-responsive transcriptional regulator